MSIVTQATQLCERQSGSRCPLFPGSQELHLDETSLKVNLGFGQHLGQGTLLLVLKDFDRKPLLYLMTFFCFTRSYLLYASFAPRYTLSTSVFLHADWHAIVQCYTVCENI